MKQKLLFFLFLLLSSSTAWAQKMVLKLEGRDAVKYDVSRVEYIAFEEGVEHKWVDLGLPSGTLWATCNVGAEKPEEYGDYFAWGETIGYNGGKSNFSFSTYKYCKGSISTITKYCTNSSAGYNGFTDNLTELLPEDDAATANWGDEWQMPSKDQFIELMNSSYTTTIWTTVNNVNGCKITSKSNGKSIFLPAAGYHDDNMLFYGTGSNGLYWSRTLNTSSSNNVFSLWVSSVNFYTDYYIYRCYGQSVRPVLVGAR